ARASDYQRAAGDVLVGVGLINGDPMDRGTRRFEGVVVLDPYVYPYADLERLLAAGAFSQWLVFLRDQYDDQPEIVRHPGAVRAIRERSFDALSTGRLGPTPSPFMRFSVYLRRRLEALSPPGWLPRFLGHVEDYLFLGSLRSIKHWSRDVTPSLDDYLLMRMYDSAVFPAIDVIEVAAGIRVPIEAREHAALAEMVRLTVRHTAYVNDLFSFQKEVLVSGTPCNLVHVLMKARSIGFEEAVDAV